MPTKDVSRELLTCQVNTSASFSIWAYGAHHLTSNGRHILLVSTGLHYTGVTLPLVHVMKNWLTLWLVPLGHTVLIHIVNFDNSDSTAENADDLSGPHNQPFFELNSFLSDLLISDNLG